MLKLTSLLTGGIVITMAYAGTDTTQTARADDVVVARAEVDASAPGMLDLDDERGAIAKALAASAATAAPVEPQKIAYTETAEDPAATDPLYTVNATNVNLRGGPSTANRVVDQARQGDRVAVLSRTDDGWMRIRLDSGAEAYIFGRFLDPIG